MLEVLKNQNGKFSVVDNESKNKILNLSDSVIDCQIISYQNESKVIVVKYFYAKENTYGLDVFDKNGYLICSFDNISKEDKTQFKAFGDLIQVYPDINATPSIPFCIINCGLGVGSSKKSVYNASSNLFKMFKKIPFCISANSNGLVIVSDSNFINDNGVKRTLDGTSLIYFNPKSEKVIKNVELTKNIQIVTKNDEFEKIQACIDGGIFRDMLDVNGEIILNSPKATKTSESVY